MGLTNQSTGVSALEKELNIDRASPSDKIIALAGNPNVGKSTIFNSLTGLNQHTGNWPGKTVSNAQGRYTHKDKSFILVDIPGTYSLMANSVEEEVARDFICFGNPDATIVILDATCLERNLNLALQTIEITNNVVICVNLLDEAKRKGINVDLTKLSLLLGVPTVGTSATTGYGLKELMDIVYNLTNNEVPINPIKIKYDKVLEDSISLIEPEVKIALKNIASKINPRWISLKLLENDPSLIQSLNKYLNINMLNNEIIKKKDNRSN